MKNETMTSRERVIKTLNHEPVDRMPIDLGIHPSTGISAFAYWNLREYLGLSTDNIWVYDTVQFLAHVDKDILERFHVDCISLEPIWPDTMHWNPRGKYKFLIPAKMKPKKNKDGDWIVRQEEQQMRMPGNGYFVDEAWLCNWGEGNEDESIKIYAAQAERIFKETQYAVNYTGYAYGPGVASYFGGIEHAIQMMRDPDSVLEMHEQVCNESIRIFEKINKAMGKYIQIISVGNDMGMQNGPMCNPNLIEKFCAPFYKKFCDFVHQTGDIKVFMHNCGSIKPLIPIFIDSGIDVLNPIQISADNMDPKELKNEFGGKIIFWGGGCDTQNILGVKTPSEVTENVRKLIKIFKPDGGFVFNQVHNIMGNVPPENIIAMLDTAYKESFY